MEITNRYGPCRQCGSESCTVEYESYVKTCHDCGGIERVNELKRCPACGSKMRVAYSKTGTDFRVQQLSCKADGCDYKAITETRIVERAYGRVRRGTGFQAVFNRLRDRMK